MARKMIRYTVLPAEAAHNEELIRGVLDELRELELEGLRYQVFVLDDGLTFVHVVEHEDGNNPLPDVPAFKRYIDDVRRRITEAPEVSGLREIGSTASELD